MPYDALIDTPVGRIGLRLAGGALAEVDLDPPVDATERLPRGDAAQRAAAALAAWFADPAAVELPLAPADTPFRQRVRDALRAIPPGETVSYGELARRLGSSARAVGAACRANPLPLIVPCHRVVAARGLGGFSGETAGPKLSLKRRLLQREGVEV